MNLLASIIMILVKILILIIFTCWGCSNLRSSGGMRIDSLGVEEVVDPRLRHTIELLKPRRTVDSSNLIPPRFSLTADVAANPLLVPKGIGLTVDAMDADGDYFEYSLCPSQNKVCLPSREQPEPVGTKVFWLPATPSGLFTIHSRTCVIASRALVKEDSCGRWVSQELQIPKVSQDEDPGIYPLSFEILELCRQVDESLRSYQEAVKGGQSEFDILVKNYLRHIHPAHCRSLMESSQWSLMEDAIANSAIDTSVEKQAGAFLLLGIPAITLSLVAYVSSRAYKFKFEPQVAKLWTPHLSSFSHTEPRMIPYQDRHSINKRLIEVSEYLTAIEARLRGVKAEEYLAQRESLATEKRFLEVYRDFATNLQTRSLFKSADRYKMQGDQKRRQTIAAELEKLLASTGSEKQDPLRWVLCFELQKTGKDSDLCLKSSESGIATPPDSQPLYGRLDLEGIVLRGLNTVAVGLEFFGMNVANLERIQGLKRQLAQLYQKVQAIRAELLLLQNSGSALSNHSVVIDFPRSN